MGEYKGDRPLRSAREARERERTEPDRPTDDHRVTMKTSRALALAALGALAVSGAVHCEPSVLDGNLLEDHVSVGIVNDLPAEIMQELTKHVHEFLEEIRPGIHEGIQKEIFEFKIDPELEALTVAESYFENPETSVLAERMLSVCESDMKNCPLLQHLPEEERVASKVVYADEGEEAGNGRKLQQVGGAKTYNTGNPNTKVPFLNVAAPPSNFGAVSGFQFYRDLYCTPPSVSPAKFNFVPSTSFTGVTYAFAILGGSAKWNPKTQILTVTSPRSFTPRPPRGGRSPEAAPPRAPRRRSPADSEAPSRRSQARASGTAPSWESRRSSSSPRRTRQSTSIRLSPRPGPPSRLGSGAGPTRTTQSAHHQTSGSARWSSTSLCRASACCQGLQGWQGWAASKKIATKHLYLSESFFLPK